MNRQLEVTGEMPAVFVDALQEGFDLGPGEGLMEFFQNLERTTGFWFHRCTKMLKCSPRFKSYRLTFWAGFSAILTLVHRRGDEPEQPLGVVHDRHALHGVETIVETAVEVEAKRI